MPDGKPAGQRCVQLNAQNLCNLFGDPSRPAVCDGFKAEESVCGSANQIALRNLNELEQLTIG
ncbi:Fe-S-cluster oxidoreductase [Thalassolituus sp. HI0120]|jgi:hypothetical protein|nr:Fe-S-cluster oxidoreductase [Thalassolituus sp. HI0120]KZZ47177.1 Fe-S-cluster oxidoreductase [Thalassolituus sp. HI0120]